MSGVLRKTDGMRVLAIVHQTDAGPGVFGEAIRVRDDELDEWLLPESAEPPADPLGYDAVFVLGGAMNVDEGDRHEWLGTERELVGRLLEPLESPCDGDFAAELFSHYRTSAMPSLPSASLAMRKPSRPTISFWRSPGPRSRCWRKSKGAN